jgi:hypothetical protein
LVTSLDTEKRQRYIFHVKATDGGGLISPNVATGNVSVENVNMKKPVVVSARVEHVWSDFYIGNEIRSGGRGCSVFIG